MSQAHPTARRPSWLSRWFAAAPTQTIPNRAFVGAATSQGHLDNAVKIFTCPSIFGALEKAGIDWAIYGYNSDPLTRHDFSDIQQAEDSHLGHFRDFQERCQVEALRQEAEGLLGITNR